MQIFHCLLVIQFVRLNSAWICSDVLKGACDATEAEERCFVPYDKVYTRPISTETHYVKQRLGCSALCLSKKCARFLLFPDMKCLLMFTSNAIPENSHTLHLMGNNVAVGKATSASRVHSSQFATANIVNGEVSTTLSNKIYQSGGVSNINVWLQIDLGNYFQIRSIRLTTGYSYSGYNLINIKIYRSNSTILNNNSHSGEEVASIVEDSPSGKGWWYSLRMNETETYYFVVIEKSMTTFDYFVLDEVEVLD